jgi:hypothetical protein
MGRPAAVDSDPALSEPVVSVCSRRLRRWVWGWAGPTVVRSRLRRPGRPCRCATRSAVSTPSLRHTLHCVASTGIAAELGKRTPESGRAEACEVAALATHGRGHRTFRRRGRNSSLVSPSLRRPLSKSACLIKTCKLCADTLAPYSATVGLIVEPRLGSYPHSAVQVLASARRSCIQLVASRPVRWSGPRAPARWRAAGVCRGFWTLGRAWRRHRSGRPSVGSGRL